MSLNFLNFQEYQECSFLISRDCVALSRHKGALQSHGMLGTKIPSIVWAPGLIGGIQSAT